MSNENNGFLLLIIIVSPNPAAIGGTYPSRSVEVKKRYYNLLIILLYFSCKFESRKRKTTKSASLLNKKACK